MSSTVSAGPLAQEQASRERALLDAMEARGINCLKWRRVVEQFTKFGTYCGKQMSAHEVVDFFSNEQPKHTTNRLCSMPKCRNLHRMLDPAMGPNGPVCGACERHV